MKKTIKLFTFLALFVLLTNCEKEEIVIDNVVEAPKFEINSITLEEFQKDKSNNRIYDAISNSLDGKDGIKDDIKKKGRSKKVTVLTDKILSVNKNDTITYSFQVKKNTSKSSVFENVVIHKYPDGTYALGLVKFKPAKKKDEFPYRIKYKKIKEKKLENFTDLDNILKNSNSCFEKVYKVVCSDGDEHEHGNWEIGNSGIGCGGTYWVYNAEGCVEDAGGIDHYPEDDDINDDPDYSDNTSTGGGSGQTGGTSAVNIPDCADSVHGCDVEARGLARELRLNPTQTDWLTQNVNYAKIKTFLDNKGDTPETREEAKLTIEVEAEKNKFDYTKKGTIRNRPSLRYKAKATISNGTSYLLETGEQVFESPSVRRINKSDAIFQTSEDDSPYYYIYYPGTDRWYDLAIDNVATNCLSCDLTYVMTKASLDALKFTGRYIVPFEDVKIIIDGKDFDGNEANRSIATGMILISIVPGGKLLKAVKLVPAGKTAWKVMSKVGDDAIELSVKVVNNVVDFGSRTKLADVIKTISGQEAHHVIPWAFRENKLIQDAAYAGFHMNAKMNGKALQKYTALTGSGIHGNHPAYNDVAEHLLNNFKSSNPSFTPKQAREFIEDTLIPELNQHIESAIQSGINLNEYFKQVVKPYYNL